MPSKFCKKKINKNHRCVVWDLKIQYDPNDAFECYSLMPKDLRLDLHHQIVYSHIQDTCLGVGIFYFNAEIELANSTTPSDRSNFLNGVQQV